MASPSDGPVEASPARIERFTGTERTLHWMHASAFFALLATGMVLYLPALSTVVNRRQLVKDVHLWVAVAWLVALAVILVAGDRRRLAEDWREIEAIDRDDRRWLRGRPGRLLRNGLRDRLRDRLATAGVDRVVRLWDLRPEADPDAAVLCHADLLRDHQHHGRHRGRRFWPQHRAGPVGLRRGRAHRPARRQPACQQLAAGGARVRSAGGAGDGAVVYLVRPVGQPQRAGREPEAGEREVLRDAAGAVLVDDVLVDLLLGRTLGDGGKVGD